MTNLVYIVDYKEYIKNFEWNVRKYNTKLPLGELCGAFMKVNNCAPPFHTCETNLPFVCRIFVDFVN